MATVVVRQLDDEVRRLLKVRAAQNDRSMEAEIRDILTTAVTPREHSPETLREAPGPARPTPPHTPSDHSFDALTTRERTVAELVSDGLSNRQIAARLYLSERTVETHVSAILAKLGVRRRAAVGALHRGRPSV